MKTLFTILLIFTSIFLTAQEQKVELISDILIGSRYQYERTTQLTCSVEGVPLEKVSFEDFLPFKLYNLCNTNWVQPQDIYNAIQAKVPGIQISSNNSNIDVPNIRMRGNENTIVIVDGIRYDASILSSLNPANIESIKVSNNPSAQNYFINQ